MYDNKAISYLQNVIKSSQELQKAFKDDPMQAVQMMGEMTAKEVPDNWIYRIVVGTLGIAIILVIVAIIILSIWSKPIEQNVLVIFTAIISGAIGALAGLLAPAP